MTWKPKGDTAQVNEHGDIVSKTSDGHQWRYEAHCANGISRYGFVSADTAKAWVSRQREDVA